MTAGDGASRTLGAHANGLRAHLAAVRSGAAMAVLPRFIAGVDPALRLVDVPRPMIVRAVRIGFHADMRDTPRIRALADFAVQAFSQIQARLDPDE